ncbi:MAG: DGQHR domain-containing protein DpdB [Planctomycetaceae bacterium]|jgi:DGQHR domain-containing protein
MTNRQTENRRANIVTLELPALEIRQGTNRRLYSFAVDGKRLHDFCTVSRVSRHDGEGLSGYQRPEVVSHITQIKDYLESDNPLLPNAIVIAFNESVRFKPAAGSKPGISRMGSLFIPIDLEAPDSEKPGWIVDGQQRTAALRDARIESFPVCVVGFVADGYEEQRQQFILVNATRPLPKGLIYELLPSTDGKLPLALARRKVPSLIAEHLNYDQDSPLAGMIRTPTNGTGVIADNSILKMLENSLTDGVLYNFENLDEQLEVIKEFWEGVKRLFPDAWGKPPRLSRLMHGAGVISMGFLMDTIADRYLSKQKLTAKLFQQELEPLRKSCHWTEGYWDFGGGETLKWNELQNVPRHIQMLSSHLLKMYRSLPAK